MGLDTIEINLVSYELIQYFWFNVCSVGFKLTRKEAEVAVPQEKMFKLKDVMEAIIKQVQGQVVLLFEDTIPDSHFLKLMSRFVSIDIEHSW